MVKYKHCAASKILARCSFTTYQPTVDQGMKYSATAVCPLEMLLPKMAYLFLYVDGYKRAEQSTKGTNFETARKKRKACLIF
jgi:hypothetical protein